MYHQLMFLFNEISEIDGSLVCWNFVWCFMAWFFLISVCLYICVWLHSVASRNAEITMEKNPTNFSWTIENQSTGSIVQQKKPGAINTFWENLFYTFSL